VYEPAYHAIFETPAQRRTLQTLSNYSGTMSSHSIGSQSSSKSVAKKGPVGRCCASMSSSYHHCVTETVAGGAVSEEYGALFNLLFAHAMFWGIGIPIVVDHGYDESRNGDNGE